MKHFFQLTAVSVSILFAVPVLAASIDWGPARSTTASAANDIVDGGRVVLALNGRSQTDSSSRRPPRSVTLDGIEFESAPIREFLGATATDIERSLSSPNSTGDRDYDAFLTHVAFANVSVSGLPGSDGNAVYRILGLKAETDYLVQLWYTDERPGVYNGFVPRVSTYSDNERVNPSTVEVPGQGDKGFGSYVVGSFTADGLSQSLRLTTDRASRSHLTGILVREGSIKCTPSRGDLNNDDIVQFADFLLLAQNFGLKVGPADGDLDCNGTVQFADFLVMAQNFGQSVGVQAVPEPRADSLWCIAVVTMMVGRNRRG